MGVSTEDSDEGGTGGTGGVNPGSSKEYSLNTENTKKAMMKEDREPKTKFTAPLPPPFTVKYVNRSTYYIHINDITQIWNPRKVNKVK